MESFSIQIEDGSIPLPKFVVDSNLRSVELYDWQRRGINYFFKNNCKAIYEACTGCITGDTLIELPRNLDLYPKGIPIKNLVNKKNFYVYSFNIEKQCIELKKVKKVWLSKRDTDVYEIKLLSGKCIKATKNHPFLFNVIEKLEAGCGRGKQGKIIRREYKKLEDLKKGDYLTTFNRANKRNNDGELVKINYKNKVRRVLEHRFIAEQVLGHLNIHDIVHHKDENRFNNSIENLEIKDSKEHNSYHAKKEVFLEQCCIKIENIQKE